MRAGDRVALAHPATARAMRSPARRRAERTPRRGCHRHRGCKPTRGCPRPDRRGAVRPLRSDAGRRVRLHRWREPTPVPRAVLQFLRRGSRRSSSRSQCGGRHRIHRVVRASRHWAASDEYDAVNDGMRGAHRVQRGEFHRTPHRQSMRTESLDTPLDALTRSEGVTHKDSSSEVETIVQIVLRRYRSRKQRPRRDRDRHHSTDDEAPPRLGPA